MGSHLAPSKSMGVNEHRSSARPGVFRTAFGGPFLFHVGMLEALFMLPALELPSRGWVSTFFQVMVVVIPVLVAYFMLTTRYRVEEGTFELRAGPFRRLIPIDSITAMSEYGLKRRGRLYGLGTDIVAVRYEGGEVGITPKDPVGLAEALGVRLTRLGDGQAPA